MQTREQIIEATINLIKREKLEDISIRKIALEASIGKSTIGYFFKSKEELLSACANKIISNLLQTFNIKELLAIDTKESLTNALEGTMSFLFQNEQIAEMSILFEMNQPKEKDNSMKMVYAFSYILWKGIVDNLSKEKAFKLTTLLQGLFLRRKQNIFGVDPYNEENRNTYLKNIVLKMVGA